MKAFRHLYGPVPSRRLGRSLGIDLVLHKICTYDCIYCQIGKTTDKTLVRKEYVPVKEILKEVRRFLKEETSSIDHLSLSGSGEPTLHSQIRSVIEGIKTITSIPVAVITNGSLLYEEKVRQDLLHADIVLPSLDAISSEVFMRINRPRPGFSVEKVIEGVVEFRKVYKGQIWLEILFCKGVNDSQEELMRMKKAVDRIQPDRIHLNTVVRPPSERWAAPLNPKEIEKIRDFFGEKAEIISEFDRHPPSMLERDIKEEIFKILRRRPLSLSDLSKGMGISQNELDQYIKPLAQEGKIQTRIYGGSIYYEISKES
ncbi:MAG: radical SAM protein [Deltaproteobacteria bacterium CG03_land_8_20_14_0_80_45_14]|nr:MAG: radical SAM protein [Deltaproteobacteria bacterium CG03_land_8_20_14_0_80_45_14]